MIKHHPKIGAILRCNYDTGFKVPEMTKIRPVVVVSPRLRQRDGLCTVVPLSNTEPAKIQAYHCVLKFDPPLPTPYDSGEHWVKADMIATVRFERLSLLLLKKDQNGTRHYDNRILTDDQLKLVQTCLKNALGLTDSG